MVMRGDGGATDLAGFAHRAGPHAVLGAGGVGRRRAALHRRHRRDRHRGRRHVDQRRRHPRTAGRRCRTCRSRSHATASALASTCGSSASPAGRCCASVAAGCTASGRVSAHRRPARTPASATRPSLAGAQRRDRRPRRRRSRRLPRARVHATARAWRSPTRAPPTRSASPEPGTTATRRRRPRWPRSGAGAVDARRRAHDRPARC